jgi:hypothetical protein
MLTLSRCMLPLPRCVLTLPRCVLTLPRCMLTLPSSPPCAAAVAALEAARVTSSSPALRKLDRAVSTPAPAERVPGDPEMDDSPAAAWYRQRKLKKVRKKKKKKKKKRKKKVRGAAGAGAHSVGACDGTPPPCRVADTTREGAHRGGRERTVGACDGTPPPCRVADTTREGAHRGGREPATAPRHRVE